MRQRVAVAVALVIASELGVAAAQTPSATDKAVAETLFQEGRKLLKQRSLEEACAKFAESNRLAPRLGTLLNLATCHEKQGKTASAWAEFSEAAAIAKQDKRKDREKYARDHAAALEKKLSRVVFEVSALPEETVVELDSEAIGRAVSGTPIPIDPGSHRLKLSAPGYKSWSKSFEVATGPATLTVTIPALEREVADTPARATAPSRTPEADTNRESDGSAQRTIGWVAIGVGVVGLGVGSYFGLQTFSKQNESEDHCSGTSCDQTGVDLRSEAKTTGTISTIAFAAGAVGLGAGLVLLLSADGAEAQATRRIWIAPGVASVMLGGSL